MSDYNSLINAADDSETKQISRNLESMKSLTDINSKSLAEGGNHSGFQVRQAVC